MGLEGQAWCSGESCHPELVVDSKQPLRRFCGGKTCLGFFPSPHPTHVGAFGTGSGLFALIIWGWIGTKLHVLVCENRNNLVSHKIRKNQLQTLFLANVSKLERFIVPTYARKMARGWFCTDSPLADSYFSLIFLHLIVQQVKIGCILICTSSTQVLEFFWSILLFL
jgi:hypothetical protein